MAKKKKQEIIQQEDLPLVSLEQLTRGIGDISREAYVKYGAYVNCHRHVADCRDGCKISYRRLIYGAYTFGKSELVPSATLIPSISRWHPHSTDGLLGTTAMMVHSKVFASAGNWGSTSPLGIEMPPSSPRYTKAGLSQLYFSLIGDLLREVPYVESPVGPEEPEYLPLPLPLCLYLQGAVSGLGVGLKVDYPNFSPWSMYQALINNDPTLLEPRVDLIMDKKNSQLHDLWNVGKGRVVYSYKISRAMSDDGRSQGILFEGDTDLFTAPIFKNKQFKKWVEEGKVYYEDVTDISGPKAFIGKVPGSKGISPEDIEELCRKNCFSGTTYNLNVTDGKSVFRIGLKTWLEYTYQNYLKLIEEVNKKRIAKCQFDIAVNQALPQIASYILNVNPKADDKELMKALDLTLEVVEAVMSKPISWLRKNQDTTLRVKQLKDRLKDLKSFDPVQFTEEIIKQL